MRHPSCDICGSMAWRTPIVTYVGPIENHIPHSNVKEYLVRKNYLCGKCSNQILLKLVENIDDSKKVGIIITSKILEDSNEYRE